MLFQSTLPRRERRSTSKNPRGRWRFQSTLPRRERLLSSSFASSVLSISIHAPAQGATISTLQREPCDAISIHAPAQGATAKMLKIWIRYRGTFQEYADTSKIIRLTRQFLILNYKYKQKILVRKLRNFSVRLGFALTRVVYTIKGSSTLKVGFAPKCSTFVL